jgi:hypothetical protein
MSVRVDLRGVGSDENEPCENRPWNDNRNEFERIGQARHEALSLRHNRCSLRKSRHSRMVIGNLAGACIREDSKWLRCDREKIVTARLQTMASGLMNSAQ